MVIHAMSMLIGRATISWSHPQTLGFKGFHCFIMFVTSLHCSPLHLHVSSSICYVTIYLQVSIVLLSVCCITVLFSTSIVSSSVCSVTILYLQILLFHCLLRHYTIFGFDC